MISVVPVKDRAALQSKGSNFFDNCDYISGARMNGKWMLALLSAAERSILEEVSMRASIRRFVEVADEQLVFFTVSSLVNLHVLEHGFRVPGRARVRAGETLRPGWGGGMRTYGKAEALTWLDGIKDQRGEPRLPGQRGDLSSGEPRDRFAFGVVNEYYWYRMPARRSAPRTSIRVWPASPPRDPGYVLDIWGARS